ncbi:MAG: hypothetical protein K9J12_06160 [Melioribacteraceae bacterium]|nr:hypothetical protein [Melioribacteraceae bacterium]MCF8431951.1 hypothetical protein [Melioribacteraceae bacterium]
MAKLITISSEEFKLTESDKKYEYQPDLTKNLDTYSGDYNADIINEIVLWKLNRFPALKEDTIKLVNEISRSKRKIDVKQSEKVLSALLTSDGINLPMASTILRFKNPNIYQIVDRRVYRILMGNKLYVNDNSTPLKIQNNINKYLTYLIDLKVFCEAKDIPFMDSDRILYMADKRLNGDIPIN